MINNNPFNDEKLYETFIWTTKIEKEGLSDVELDYLQKIRIQ